jgi:hypothetical protein
MWMDLLLTIIAVAPLLPVTRTHLRSAEAPRNNPPEVTSIPMLALQASPTGPPRQGLEL